MLSQPWKLNNFEIKPLTLHRSSLSDPLGKSSATLKSVAEMRSVYLHDTYIHVGRILYMTILHHDAEVLVHIDPSGGAGRAIIANTGTTDAFFSLFLYAVDSCSSRP